MITVLVVGEVRLYREGIADVFARENDFAVVGTASGVEEAFARAEEAEPDVAVVDLGTLGGVTVARGLGEVSAGTKMIALAVREVEEEVVALAEAGVAGYVTREQSLSELVAAVRSVAEGETLCSPWLAATLLRRVGELARDPLPSTDAERLTVREREIVALIDDGLSNKEIATRLTIELSTVKNHVHNILEKLNVHQRSQAAAVARGRRI